MMSRRLCCCLIKSLPRPVVLLQVYELGQLLGHCNCNHFVDQKLNLFDAIKSHFRGRCHKFSQFLHLRFTVAHI